MLVIVWLVFWTWGRFLAEERTIPKLAVTLAITSFAYGAVIGVLIQVAMAMEVSILPGDQIGAHASAMTFGYIVLAALTEKQFVSLMRTLGRPDALEDPRFKDWASRTEHEPELRKIIEEQLATDTPKSWEARLTAADVPCGAIWTISTSLTSSS